eukprot:915271-Amphidinium_carterae.4
MQIGPASAAVEFDDPLVSHSDGRGRAAQTFGVGMAGRSRSTSETAAWSSSVAREVAPESELPIHRSLSEPRCITTFGGSTRQGRRNPLDGGDTSVQSPHINALAGATIDKPVSRGRNALGKVVSRSPSWGPVEYFLSDPPDTPTTTQAPGETLIVAQLVDNVPFGTGNGDWGSEDLLRLYLELRTIGPGRNDLQARQQVCDMRGLNMKLFWRGFWRE